MNGRCATCKYIKQDTLYGPGVGWGECKRMEGIDGSPQDVTSLAWAADAESYRAGVWVHETFGCVQWEKADG